MSKVEAESEAEGGLKGLESTSDPQPIEVGSEALEVTVALAVAAAAVVKGMESDEPNAAKVVAEAESEAGGSAGSRGGGNSSLVRSITSGVGAGRGADQGA